MNLSLNNIRIKKYKGLCKPKIEEKLIFLKKEKESLLEEITSLKNTLDKKIIIHLTIHTSLEGKIVILLIAVYYYMNF